MFKRLLLFQLLFATALCPARDKSENWIEVRSEHFVVATNSSEKQGRQIADQFERMRAVFHVRLPNLKSDGDSPIIVLVVKNEKDFRALEPEVYLAKGQLKLGGLFLRAPDKNYVLLRLDAEGNHPYAVVYHEYTHFLLAKFAEWMPLWLNEGLAQFYENTDIHEKDVSLGEPSVENIVLLRQNKLLPLPTLFKVDNKSPYYHEESKGSIFYAESWALTHFITITDFKEKTHRLTDYAELLAKNVDPISAANAAFGDLNKLQFQLNNYVGQGSFSYFKMATTTQIDDSTFKAQALTPAQADALRADFLAYNDRTADARALLDQVLKEDPQNVSAHETMGYLEFRQGHLEEAKNWYAKAVQYDSQSYLAHYYFAAMSMAGSVSASDEAKVESSLRSAIKLNPAFGPAFDRLAVFLATHHRGLEEAHQMGLMAVSLEPANVGYRINVANVLMAMEQGKNAVQVLRVAAKLTKTPQESQAVDNALMNAQEYAESQERVAEEERRMDGESRDAESSTNAGPSPAVPQLAHRDAFVANGPHRFLVGTLKDVHCDSQRMDLTVVASGKSLTLHAENYYKLAFSALGFKPNGDLNPCKDLEGRSAKVEYVEPADKSATARVLGIEMHK